MRLASFFRRSTRRAHRWSASALRCSALLLLSACAASVWPTDADFYDICSGSAALARVELSPTERVSMRVGEQLQVRAQLIDAQSNPMVLCAPTVSWSSGTAEVATVADGTVRATGVGQTIITASAGDKSAMLTVVVTNAAPASLTLSQDTAMLLVGQTLRFTAVGRDSSGVAISPQAIVWSTSDSSLATLSGPNTILTAHRLGTVLVRATVGTRVATARVEIVSGAPVVKVRDLAAGVMHSCALVGGGGIPEGTAYCWGEGINGALGTGAVQARAVPTKVAGGLTFISIAAGSRGTCAIATGGSAYCWGDNASGQLGDGTAGSYSTTPRPVATTQTFRAIRLGGGLACGLTATGAVYCWGAHATGILRVPTVVAGGRQYVELTASGGDVCGRTSTGDAYCWSARGAWNVSSPTRVSSPVAFTQLNAGPYHACGLSGDGTAYCWGIVSGQLGPGVPSRAYTAATAVAVVQRFSSLAVGGNFTCGISEGRSYCLGSTGMLNADGLDPNPRLIPNDAQHPFVQLTGGSFHGCAIDALGGGWCFGRGYEGQLGAGDYALPSGIPLQLRFIP